MKFKNLLSIFIFTAIAATACAETPETPVTGSDPAENEFARGADVSWLTQMEAEGEVFYTKSEPRRPMECMQLLRDECGVNAIRLRVWVNPADGMNGKDDVLVKARRAHNLGMDLMIDFHFSDTWADPGHQEMPQAWKNLDLNALTAAVAAHVTDILTSLKNEGIEPRWVQIGNETTPGMMLPVGALENGAQLTALNNAGHDAAKAVFPNVKTIVHLDNGNDRARYVRMFDVLESNGARYDMIGMSLYPFWAIQSGLADNWQQVAVDCINNINYLKKRYDKPVMICEIGMSYDQSEDCRDLISTMMKAPVEGIFYWEPQAPAGYNDGYTMGCFDNGSPTVALDAFLSR